MAESDQRVLVVFVDAFGPTQLARAAEALPSLPHHRPLEGVLGYSSGALATVLTGAPPAAHGRMCLFTQRQPDASGILEPLRWLGLLPRIVHERGRVRHLVGKAFKRAAGLTGYVALHRVPPEHFAWLDLPEREDLFQARNIGGVSTFLADAREAGLGVYAAPWQKPEPVRWQEAHHAIRTTRPDLAFLYATELDAQLHARGNDPETIADVIGRVGREIERAREEMARGGGQLTTLVVGDHGMADVHRYLDPRPVLRRIDTKHFVDSTMLRLWGEPAALGRARIRIESAGWPGRWLSTTALRERGAPTEGAPYGDAFFLLDEGVIFVPSFVGGAVAGMHGYDVGAGSAQAALASDTEIPSSCGSIAGVAGLVRERLGLGPARVREAAVEERP